MSERDFIEFLDSPCHTWDEFRVWRKGQRRAQRLYPLLSLLVLVGFVVWTMLCPA